MIISTNEIKISRHWTTSAVQVLIAFGVVYFLSVQLLAAELKVTSEEITRLEALLKKNSMLGSNAEIQQLNELFRSRSAAHRIRLSQIFLTLAKDPTFKVEFPELKDLVRKPWQTILAELEHDASKGSAAAEKAIRVLSLTQGLNKRNPPPGFTAEDQKLLVQTMQNAIDDLNTLDDKFMKEALKKVSPNAAWTKAHESLTETIDFYDTYKSRQEELAKDGKALISPSKWIEQLEKEDHYSELDKKDNVLKKRLALYLENVDPLKNKSAFAVTKDFTGLPGKEPFEKELENKFAGKSSKLLAQASRMRMLQEVSRFGKFVKGVPGSYALMFGVNYLVSPETANATDTLADMVFSSVTSDCDSIDCQKFFRDCATLLKVKVANKDALLANKEFPKCLAQFFKKPLDEQYFLRQDVNLERVLAGYAPAITGLKCSNEGKTVEVEVPGENHKILTEKITFGKSGSPTLITNNDPGTQIHDRLVFNNSEAQVFQHCATAAACKNYEIDDVLGISLGFWRDDRAPRILSGPLQRVPIESFKWARKGYQTAENLSDSIKNCCESEGCQKFYDQKKSSSGQAGLNVNRRR